MRSATNDCYYAVFATRLGWMAFIARENHRQTTGFRASFEEIRLGGARSATSRLGQAARRRFAARRTAASLRRRRSGRFSGHHCRFGRNDGVSAKSPEALPADPLRKNDDLRRVGRPGRRAACRPGGGKLHGAKPHSAHHSLPSRRAVGRPIRQFLRPRRNGNESTTARNGTPSRHIVGQICNLSNDRCPRVERGERRSRQRLSTCVAHADPD